MGRLYAGIFVERRRCRVFVGEHTGDDQFEGGYRPMLRQVAVRSFEYIDSAMLAEAGSWLASAYPGVAGIGIAGYGPFLSLDPLDVLPEWAEDGDDPYGRLHPRRASAPFAGMSLPRFVVNAFAAVDRDIPPILVETDAGAAALGEAWLAGVGSRELNTVTAAVMLTEGVGAGFASGLSIIRGGHHPEIGLIDVPMFAGDALEDSEIYAGISDVGRLACESAMLERARLLGYEVEAIEDVFALEDSGLWPMWAKYVARVCLAIVVVLSPTRIALTGPLTAGYRCLQAVQKEFETLWQERSGAPLLQYAALEETDFIAFARRQGELDAELAGAVLVALNAGQSRPSAARPAEGNVVPMPVNRPDRRL